MVLRQGGLVAIRLSDNVERHANLRLSWTESILQDMDIAQGHVRLSTKESNLPKRNGLISSWQTFGSMNSNLLEIRYCLSKLSSPQVTVLLLKVVATETTTFAWQSLPLRLDRLNLIRQTVLHNF